VHTLITKKASAMGGYWLKCH